METSTTRPGDKRRRGKTLENAIMQATLDELSEVGYQRLTVEKAAERARTSRSVLYRRWPTKAALVLAALRWQGPVFSREVPDTGSVRSDVLVLLGRITQRLKEISMDTLVGIVAEYGKNIPVSLRQDVQQRGTDIVLEILQRGVQRGEIRADRVTPRIASLPVDLVRHDLFVTQRPVTEEVTEEIVDTVFLPLVRQD